MIGGPASHAEVNASCFWCGRSGQKLASCCDRGCGFSCADIVDCRDFLLAQLSDDRARPGEWPELPEALIRSALADAITLRLPGAECDNCQAAPPGKSCAEHEEDLRLAVRYDALLKELSDGARLPVVRVTDAQQQAARAIEARGEAGRPVPDAPAVRKIAAAGEPG